MVFWTPKSVLCPQPSGGKGFLEQAKQESESLGKHWFLSHKEGNLCSNVPMKPGHQDLKMLGGYLGGLPRAARLAEVWPWGRPCGGCDELSTGCPSTQMLQSAPILSPGHANFLCVPGPRPWGREGPVESTDMGTWSGLSGLCNCLGTPRGHTRREFQSLKRHLWVPSASSKTILLVKSFEPKGLDLSIILEPEL